MISTMGIEGVEALGEAVTGGMIGRAVEPGAGEAHQGEHGGACLNCGTALTGPYCHACGQPAHVHRTLSAFWHDLAHGVLHFEGKTWRTLPLLAWKPGELTRHYVEGQRARFVSPMALFLFSVFVMFAVFSWVGGPVGGTGAHQTGKILSDINDQQGKLNERLAQLQERRAEAVADKAKPERLARIDARIAETRQAIGAVNAVSSINKGEPIKEAETPSVVDIKTDGNLGWFDEAYRKAKHNPTLLLYKLQSNAYKFSWLLIPLSVPFVSLLFLHRRRYRQYKAYDHVVFVTYSLSFMTLLVVALSLLHALGVSSGLSVLALTFVPPIHMYRQLKGAYGLSRSSALWRTAMMVVFAGIVITIFMLILVLLGVMH
jgi:hypothetical protein